MRSALARGIALAALALMLALTGACATTETIKQTRGDGSKRLYPHDAKAVHAAVLATAKAKDLQIVEGGTDSLVLSHGVSWRSFGERIAVFIRSISPRLTEVEVVSKPVFGTWNFPRDWEIAVLDGVGRSVRDGQN